MMSNPLISVIIPLYNAETTIAATIQSVLQQTFADFELIVVNDGSTDQSLPMVQAILQATNDKRLKILDTANAGASAARNRGIAQARGEYLAFLDADDLWHPDKLQDQLEILQTHPEIGLVYSWTDYIDTEGQFVCPGRREIVQGNVYAKLLVANFLENGSAALIRCQIVRDIGGFDEQLTGCQDTDLYLRIARHHFFMTVPKVQVYYRISPGSITDDTARHEERLLMFLQKAYADAPDELQSLKPQSLAHAYRYLMLRSLEATLTPVRGFNTAQYLWRAVYYNPSLATRQTRLLLTVVAKIVIAFLPQQLGHFLLSFTNRQRKRQRLSQHD